MIKNQLYLGSVLTACSSYAMAHNAIPFKQELPSTMHWLAYGVVTLFLFCLLIYLKYYVKPKTSAHPAKHSVKIIPLHGKTKAYVLTIQGQQVIIADNQHAIAIHSLPPETPIS